MKSLAVWFPALRDLALTLTNNSLLAVAVEEYVTARLHGVSTQLQRLRLDLRERKSLPGYRKFELYLRDHLGEFAQLRTLEVLVEPCLDQKQYAQVEGENEPRGADPKFTVPFLVQLKNMPMLREIYVHFNLLGSALSCGNAFKRILLDAIVSARSLQSISLQSMIFVQYKN